MYIPIPHLKRHMTREQLEELKKEINKTEYEKAREPLQEEIKKLNGEIYDLKKERDIYRSVINEIVTSIKDDCIDIYVIPNSLECSLWDNDNINKPTYLETKKITIPVKENLRRNIYERIYKSKGE